VDQRRAEVTVWWISSRVGVTVLWIRGGWSHRFIYQHDVFLDKAFIAALCLKIITSGK
jgi:hypothetical protein